jgi:hypothetical protein
MLQLIGKVTACILTVFDFSFFFGLEHAADFVRLLILNVQRVSFWVYSM